MNSYSNYLINLLVLDDITAAVTRQRSQASIDGITGLGDCMINGRELYEGVALSVHSLSGLSDLERQNARCIFVCGLRGENPEIVCNTLGITRKQFQNFFSAQVNEALCTNPQLFDQTVYFTFDPPKIPGLCDENQRLRARDQFMAQIKTTPPAPLSDFMAKRPQALPNEKTSTPTLELPPKESNFLMVVATGPVKTIMAIYQTLSLTTSEGRRITKRLEALGLICIHAFSTGKIGGKVKFFEITEAGWFYLREKGITPPKKLTDGGWEHDLAAQLLEATGKRQGYKVSFEVDCGGVRGDVQWLDPTNGQRHLFNIGISNPKREVDTIEKFYRLPASNSCPFTLVVRDSVFSKKVKVLLKARNLKKTLSKRFEMKFITDFINP